MHESILFSSEFLDKHHPIPCLTDLPSEPSDIPHFFILDCEIRTGKSIDVIETELSSKNLHFIMITDPRLNAHRTYYTWTDHIKPHSIHKRLWVCSGSPIDYDVFSTPLFPHPLDKTKHITYALRGTLETQLSLEPKRISLYVYPHEHKHCIQLLEDHHYKVYGSYNTYSNASLINILAVRHDVEDDISFIVQGIPTSTITDITRNICFQHGIPIDATWNDKELRLVKRAIRKHNYNNRQNLHCHCFSTITGINRSKTAFVIKVRADEYYTEWGAFIKTMKDNRDKITTNNIFARKVTRLPYHPSDHVMAGTKNNMLMMFEETIMNTKTRRFLESVAEQNFAFGFMLGKGLIPRYHVCYDRSVVEKLMREHFAIVSICDMGLVHISAFGTSYTFADTPDKKKDSRYVKYVDIESLDDMFIPAPTSM